MAGRERPGRFRDCPCGHCNCIAGARQYLALPSSGVLASGIIRKVNSGMGMVTGIDLEKGATVRAP